MHRNLTKKKTVYTVEDVARFATNSVNLVPDLCCMKSEIKCPGCNIGCICEDFESGI